MNPGFSKGTPASVRFVAAELDSWPLRGPRRAAAGPIRELHLEVTHRCDLKCGMCHHWRLKPAGPEISPSALARLLDGTELLKDIKTAVLTGGEPFLRPDLAELAGVIAARFPKISLGVLSNLSNGPLLFKGLEKLLAKVPAGLWLGSSLDGLGAAHDKVRGSRGAWARTMKSARQLRSRFPGISLSFNFTLLPSNAGALFETYLAAKELKIWFGAQKVVNHEGLEAENYTWTRAVLKTALRQTDLVITDICAEHKAFELLMQGRAAQAPWLWNTLIYWLRLRQYLAAPGRLMDDCLCGERYAMLSPAGDLFFCPVRKHRAVGNVLEEGFDKAWRGRRAAAERKAIAAGRCHCWLLCTANPVIDAAVTARLALEAKPCPG
ncbi:MAG: radical SAM protein [Elusimicrobiales bacterium]|nr:radical SAM protein [Elusimicrobiales bacterium]